MKSVLFSVVTRNLWYVLRLVLLLLTQNYRRYLYGSCSKVKKKNGSIFGNFSKFFPYAGFPLFEPELVTSEEFYDAGNDRGV